MEAPTELTVRPLDARHVSRTAAHAIPVHLLLRIGILAIAAATAYHYSLTLLVGDLARQSPIGYLALVPVLAVALAARTALRPRREPAIHDRYVDYIIGLPLLVGALWMTMVLPVQLSLFYWAWRLDLLSLPLFVAGAVCLVFGLRALWRYRLPVAYLLLAWPIPHVWLIHQLPADLNVQLVMALGGVGLVVIALALVIAGRFTSKDHAVEPRGQPALAVRHARIALTLVLLAGLGIAVADSSMSRFELTLLDTGDSRLPQFDAAAAQLEGWSLSQRTSASPARLSLGAASTWDRYTSQSDSGRLPATGSAASAVSLDVFSTTDPHTLSGYPLDVLYRFHGYRLLDQHVVDLGAGIIGHAVVYADPTGRTHWTAVYWDWPVVSGDGPAFQRLVINQRTAAVSDPPGAPRPDLLATSPQLALVNWLDGTGPLDPALLQERAILVDTARSVVRAEVGSLPAGDRP